MDPFIEVELFIWDGDQGGGKRTDDGIKPQNKVRSPMKGVKGEKRPQDNSLGGRKEKAGGSLRKCYHWCDQKSGEHRVVRQRKGYLQRKGAQIC